MTYTSYVIVLTKEFHVIVLNFADQLLASSLLYLFFFLFCVETIFRVYVHSEISRNIAFKINIAIKMGGVTSPCKTLAGLEVQLQTPYLY
jgi:hypothetical protein